MDKKQELQNWINKGSNFSRGVELCKKHNIRPDLHNTTFLDGATAGNKKLLMSVIKGEIKHLSSDNEIVQVAVSGEEKKIIMRAKLKENFGLQKRYPNIKLATAPAFIKQMFSEAIGSWNNAVESHDERLFAAETDEQRFAIMNEIMDSIEKNEDAHKELRHFNDTGEFLGEHPLYQEFLALEENQKTKSSDPQRSELEKKFRSMDSVELVKKRNNLRSKASKARKDLENDKENVEKMEILKSIEDAIKLADNILNEK